jgi:serine/threonine protein kinase
LWADLDLKEQIAAGAFKTVHRAHFRSMEVAVLQLRRGDITTEAAVFDRLGKHRHLTRLVGLSRNPEGKQVLITEFAPCGSLSKVLSALEERGRRASDAVLVRIAMQVCQGMIHMVEEGMIHRDLAARNVLVFAIDDDATNASRVLVKIADYGLAKDASSYYCALGDELPMRWMSPEAILRRRFSEKSDVFAFGVLLWELWSYAELPFSFFSDAQVGSKVTAGERLAQPKGCPQAAYKLMERCWDAVPTTRPTFAELYDELLALYASVSVGPGPSEPTCVICLERPPTMAASPCGHRCFCAEDAKKIVGQPCPMCRQRVKSVLAIFVA